MSVVERVLKPKTARHRQVPGLCELLQSERAARCPAAATDQHQGTLRGLQQTAPARQVCSGGYGAHRFHARQHGGLGHARHHVFGHRQHHRAGPPLQRGVESPGDVLRQASGVTHLGSPFGHAQGSRPKELSVVEFLKGLAVAKLSTHLTHDHHQGRAVLERGVDADGGVGGARPPGDHAHTRAAGQLPVRLGHEGRTALLPTGHEADAGLVGMKPVECRQETFAGHAEDRVHALLDERLHDHMPARTGLCPIRPGVDAGEAGRSLARVHDADPVAKGGAWCRRLPTQVAEATPKHRAKAAPTNKLLEPPWSSSHPNTGAATAKPTSRPEYTVP